MKCWRPPPPSLSTQIASTLWGAGGPRETSPFHGSLPVKQRLPIHRVDHLGCESCPGGLLRSRNDTGALHELQPVFCSPHLLLEAYF